MAPVGGVDEGQHDAVDLVVDGAIGPQPNLEPAILPAANFALDRHQVGQHRLRVMDQGLVFQPVREIGDRPALVARGDAEQLGHLLREPLDAQARVEKQGPEIGRRHQVLQVAMRARDQFELPLQLAVHGLQLFIDRLQFLLAGFELLGG